MEPKVTIELTLAERQLLAACLQAAYSDIEDVELQCRVGELLIKVEAKN